VFGLESFYCTSEASHSSGVQGVPIVLYFDTHHLIAKIHWEILHRKQCC